MKKIFIYSIICLCVLTSNAQPRIKIWEGTEIRSKWSELTIFLPDSVKNNHTAVIICPGGSYHHLGLKHEGYEVAKKMAAEGFTAFVLRYRIGMLGYHHPAMIQDIQRSIQLVNENNQLLNIEKGRVGLIGFSAGGHLVGSAATFFNEDYLAQIGIKHHESLKPLFTVMMYPVVTMYQPYGHVRSKNNLIGKHSSDSMIYKMSLEKSVHPGMDHILIIQAKDDPVVQYNNAVLMDEAMTKLHINHQLLLFNTGGHGFGAFPDQNSEMKNWFSDMLDWLKKEKIIK